ncbi:MAG: glutathione S-transferase family protein [Acetobacteraceae bacterium]
MILIGQFDSPFVRRVGIALYLYGLSYEHQPWSTFSDADRIAPYNPLLRVPTLVLDNGESLIESGAILDHLDETVGPARAMMPREGQGRRQQLRTCGLATGLADKAVGLFYERAVHAQVSEPWSERLVMQIRGVLDALEAERRAVPSVWWFGDAIGHGDIAVACALRFATDALPGLFDPATWPALASHATACEALPAFQSVVQPFRPPD